MAEIKQLLAVIIDTFKGLSLAGNEQKDLNTFSAEVSVCHRLHCDLRFHVLRFGTRSNLSVWFEIWFSSYISELGFRWLSVVGTIGECILKIKP